MIKNVTSEKALEVFRTDLYLSEYTLYDIGPVDSSVGVPLKYIITLDASAFSKDVHSVFCLCFPAREDDAAGGADLHYCTSSPQFFVSRVCIDKNKVFTKDINGNIFVIL